MAKCSGYDGLPSSLPAKTLIVNAYFLTRIYRSRHTDSNLLTNVSTAVLLYSSAIRTKDTPVLVQSSVTKLRGLALFGPCRTQIRGCRRFLDKVQHDAASLR